MAGIDGGIKLQIKIRGIMDKDWIGDSISVYKTLGASNHCNDEREQDDFYATNPKTLRLFLDRIAEDNITLNHNIWECACGKGHISKTLENTGYNVYSTDLIDRNYGIGNVDFLQVDKRPFNNTFDILTNPPYKFAEQFVYKALSLLNDGEKCIMILKIQFLEGKSRYNLFEKYPPKYVYVHSTRQACAPNGEFIKDGKEVGSAVCYAWYIWEKGFKGDPVIRWIK